MHFGRFVLFGLLTVLLCSSVLALERDGHINILAVTETDDGNRSGSSADLFLEIRDGQGRVFIETFPFSKFDTQISTRFAKDVACKLLDRDCSQYDFFYRIQADAALIGGPSAGAATAVLTAALLEDVDPDSDVAITGTISSGGIIGPVGGIKEKIEAAHAAGRSKVLIPIGTTEEFGNVTLNFTQYGKEIGIEVIEVTTLPQALFEFTGLERDRTQGTIIVDDTYQSTMEALARDLCERTTELQLEYQKQGIPSTINTTATGIDDIESGSTNFTARSGIAFDTGDFYSAASYCFGANVNYRYLNFVIQNITSGKTIDLIERTSSEIEEFKSELAARELETITDLQTLMVVSERIREAEETLVNTRNQINDSYARQYGIAYAIERLYSAYSWSSFFGQPGPEYDITNENLARSCTIKLAEAEEIVQYAALYLPGITDDQDDILVDVRSDKREGRYAECLFKAAKAKAEASAILSSLGVGEEGLSDFIDQKLGVARSVIIDESLDGRFPIVGYSYYEYANSLKDANPYSSLVYSEYALELSNFDLYFDRKKTSEPLDIPWDLVLLFTIGLVVGIAVRSIPWKRKEAVIPPPARRKPSSKKKTTRKSTRSRK